MRVILIKHRLAHYINVTFIHFYAAPGVRPSQLLHKICTITSTAWSWSIFEPTDALQSLDVPHSAMFAVKYTGLCS